MISPDLTISSLSPAIGHRYKIFNEASVGLLHIETVN